MPPAPFMVPELSERREWYELDGTTGRLWIGADDFTAATAVELYEGRLWSVGKVTGWGVRLTAPGYLDCTEWTVYETEAEAQAAIDRLMVEAFGEWADDGPDEASDLATREGGGNQ